MKGPKGFMTPLCRSQFRDLHVPLFLTTFEVLKKTFFFLKSDTIFFHGEIQVKGELTQMGKVLLHMRFQAGIPKKRLERDFNVSIKIVRKYLQNVPTKM